MQTFHRAVLTALLAAVLPFGATLSGQTKPMPAPVLTDQQKKGEALFLQKCPLCHVPSNQKKTLGIQASTDLVGLFKRPTVSEPAVRRVILEGITGLMPSFRYSFSTPELDDLIAYLKVR